MKKQMFYILCFIFVVWSTNIHAQKQGVKEIVLNFTDKNIDGPHYIEDVKPNDFYRIKIKYLNTYLYNVKTESKDSVVDTSLPTFSGGLFNTLNLASINELVSKLSPLFINVVSDDKAIKRKGAKEAKEINEVKQKLLLMHYTLINYKNDLFVLNKEYNKINREIVKFSKDISIEQYDSRSIMPGKKDIDKIIDDYNTLNDKTYTKLGEMTTAYSDFLKSSHTHILITSKNKSLQEEKSFIDALYNALDKKYNELSEFTSINKLDKARELLTTIYNKKDFVYKTFPKQRRGDITELNIKITPRDSLTRLDTHKISITFLEDKTTFWGVSTGVYITKNRNENYSVKAVMDSSNNQTFNLVKEDSGKQEVGINAMVRYGWQIGNNTYFQLGLGPGVNITDKIKPRILFGLGLAYGEKNKLFVDIGGVYMFYDKLSNAVDLTNNLNKPESYLVTATKIQGYASLGYTINLN